MQPGRARTSGLGVPLLPLARWAGWVAPVRPTHGVLVLSCPSAALRVCSVLGCLAPVHRCARAVCCIASAVSWATWLLFTGVLARCVVLRVRCPGPLGSRSTVRPLGVSCCVCGVPGHLAPVHRCARSVCCFECAVSWATWLLFTGVPVRCVVLRVRCPGPLGSCSPVCPRCLLCCFRGVLGHLAPVHRCVRSVCCVACAVSWATWLPFTGAPAGCVVLRVRCAGPLGSCSPVRLLGVLLCLYGVLGPLAPAHRCARSLCCVACAMSWATWLLFTGALARCVALCARCPGPLGSCSPVCQAVVSCPFVALAARACAMSWPSWRPFTGVRAVCVVRVCHWWLCPSSSPPNFRFFFDEKKRKTGARAHCRHRHGQLVRRCNSVVSSGVCRRCCGGGRAPGVWLARSDVHGHGPGWVWLGVSLLLELAG